MAVIHMDEIGLALDVYARDNGTYPSTEQGLKSLINRPTSPPEPSNWDGPYVEVDTELVDPWGNEYIYEYPGMRRRYDYDLYSLGADGLEGGTGMDADITYWSEEYE